MPKNLVPQGCNYVINSYVEARIGQVKSHKSKKTPFPAPPAFKIMVYCGDYYLWIMLYVT